MTTGHDGSLTTVHAKSPDDALRRIELLALMAGLELPHAAVREQVASAFDIVVQVARRSDGARCLVSVHGVEREGRGWRLVPRAAVERRCAEGAAV
jgi:pilus assembly protein CpaF